MPIGIVALGMHVPPDDCIVTNAQLAPAAGVDPEWIAERTGIRERRHARPGTPTSELARLAVHDLAHRHPGALDDIAMIVLATSTPDQPQPATATILQGLLHEDGLLADRPVPGFDINAVCAGWLYALAAGLGLGPLLSGPILVGGADRYSSILRWSDRRTAPLFGDGAGFVVLDEVPDGYGVLSVRFVADGRHRQVVEVAAGGTRQPIDADALAAGAHLFAMDGRATTAWVMATLPDLIRDAVSAAGLTLADVDRFVCHQANPKMLRMIADVLDVDPARFPLSAPLYGNTSTASIPVTLALANAERPLDSGEVIVLATVGGGLTAGVVVYRWAPASSPAASTNS